MPEPNNKPKADRSAVLTAVLAFLAILGIALGLWLLVRLHSIVVLLLISIVFATGLAPGVVWLERKKIRRRNIPRALAILLVFVLAAIIALGALTLIVVPVVREAIQFAENAPQYLTAVQDWLGDLHARYAWIPDYAGLVDRAQRQLGSVGNYLLASAPAAFGFFGSVLSVVTVIVLTFYLLSGFEGIKKTFIALLPRDQEKKANTVLSNMASTMGGWLRGQLLLAGIVGTSTALAMLLIGVPYPFVIAVIGAIGELVPMVGPFAAAIPAIIILAVQGNTVGLILALVFFTILANVEGNYLAPKIMQKQVGLSPLTTLIALLAGASLLGLVGALLAVPLAAGLRVLFLEVVTPAVRKSVGRKG